MIIYVVTGSVNDYDEGSHWIVKAFLDADKANQHADEMRARLVADFEAFMAWKKRMNEIAPTVRGWSVERVEWVQKNPAPSLADERTEYSVEEVELE